MKQKIYFRADASADIGYGHFIRTLALADMLKDNFDCTYYTVEPTDYQIKELSKVCRYVSLNKETHFQDFLSYLIGDEIVVLDNYYYSTEYQQAIKDKGCKLVCIDDMHDKHYVCDVLVSHGFSNISQFDSCASIKCIGPEWALLRSPFLKRTDNKQKRINQIVVNFGGADPYHITNKVLCILSNLNTNYYIKAIVGTNTVLPNIISNKIKILKNLSAQQMADLFHSSLFGILSASTVCLEAMSCSLPLIVGYHVDNQKETYTAMADRGIIIPIGYLQKLTIDTLRKSIKALDYVKRYDLHPELIRDKYISLFNNLCSH